MDRPTLVCWLFACILGPGLPGLDPAGPRVHARPGRGDHPRHADHACRAMSVTQAADDLKARDAVLRGVPRGLHGGRQGRPGRDGDRPGAARHDRDDRQPPRPRRSGRSGSSGSTTPSARPGPRSRPWRRRGSCRPRHGRRPRGPGQRGGHGRSSSRVDATLRDLALLRLDEFRPELGRRLVGEAVDALLDRVDPRSVRRALDARPSGRTCSTALAATHGDRLALEPRLDDVTALVKDASRRLVALGVAPATTRTSSPRRRARWSGPPTPRASCSGSSRQTLFTRITDAARRGARGRARGADPRRSTGSSSTAPWGPPPGPRSRS